MVRNYWEKMEDWEKDQAGSLLHHQDCAHICRTGCSIHSLLGQGAEKLGKGTESKKRRPQSEWLWAEGQLQTRRGSPEGLEAGPHLGNTASRAALSCFLLCISHPFTPC